MMPYCKGTHCDNCVIFCGHLWKGFDEESKKDLCSITFPIRYRRRQVIMMESNPSQNIYVVKMGLVKTYKSLPGGKQQIIQIIKKQDFFNLHSLFDDFCHHSAEALVDSELCAVDKNMLENLLQKKPKTALIIIEFMKKKLVHSYQKIRDLGQKNARARIASFLLDLSENLYEAPQQKFILPLSRGEFAEVVGISEETGIRILGDYKQQRLIDVDKSEITLLDIPRLQRISDK